MENDIGEKQKKKMGTPAKIGLAIFALFVVVSLFGGEDDGGSNLSTDTTSASAIASSELSEIDDSMTGPQRNAQREAQNYIKMKGFSRDGLIEQLSSEYGSDYALEDATFAVDSLNADWNEQAAREAASYLEMKGFSCNGLVEQLSSEYGSKYTVEQAKFGATQAGAC